MNFLDRNESRFRSLRGACDSVSRMLRKGVGAEIKHAEIFTPGEEDKLWSRIGIHFPQALVHAVFLPG